MKKGMKIFIPFYFADIDKYNLHQAYIKAT
jgi:hypothetical protein